MIEREQIEMDVVFVGAGPANLAGALWLKQKVAEHDEFIERGIKQGNKIGDIEIAIVEKGSSSGHTSLAVPSWIRSLSAS